MYPETARPKLARSLPPECAKRVKLLRGAVNRLPSAGAGIAGRAGGACGSGAGLAESSAGATAGGAVGEDGPPASPSDPSHEGTSGVPPPGPPYAVEVPTIGFPFASYSQPLQRPLASCCQIALTTRRPTETYAPARHCP